MDEKALKAGAWYTASNFLIRGVVFLSTGIFTRLLTKTEFGLYNNYTSCLLIATVLVTLNLDSTLVSARFDYKEELDKYCISVLVLSSVSALAWMGIVNFFRGFFTQLCGIEIGYLNAMLVYLFFSPAVLLYQERERFRQEYQRTVAITVAISLGTLVCSVLFIRIMTRRLTGIILGSVLPTVLLGVIMYRSFAVKGQRIDTKYWRYALPIALPYIPHLLSTTVLHAMDKVMITRLCGPEDNAIYSLAYTCASVVALLTMSVNSAYSPWLGNRLESGTDADKRDIRSFSKVYIGCFFVLSVGMMAFTPEVLYILGGEAYMEARFVMAPVSMGCIFQFLYTIFVNVEQYKKKTVGMAVASVAAAALNCILNAFFIPRFGYLAAAYTTLVGYLFLLLIHMYLVKRLGLASIYSYRFVLVICACGIAVMILMVYLYTSILLRYLAAAVYAAMVLAVLNKNRATVEAVIRTLLK